MKAVFTGTLASGFCLKRIYADDSAAEEAVVRMLANGELAEAMEVQPPSALDRKAKYGKKGDFFIVYGNGLGNGFEVFGPFGDGEEAVEFGEDNRGSDSEWEMFEVRKYE